VNTLTEISSVRGYSFRATYFAGCAQERSHTPRGTVAAKRLLTYIHSRK
jgi:hypothetical protein